MITKADVEYFLSKFEDEYLFFNQLCDYKKSKSKLLCQKRISIDMFNEWLKITCDNKNDVYTKCGCMQEFNCQFFADVIINDVMYIKTNCFSSENTSNVLSTLQSSAQKYLILDLRNNCGGSVESVIKIANLLLNSCQICTLNFNNRSIIYYSDNNKKMFEKIFVFTNSTTFSSAEILAMSLALNSNNTFVIGSKTYGKFLGQKKVISNNGKYYISFTSFDWQVCNYRIKEFHDVITSQNRWFYINNDASYNDYVSEFIRIINFD